MFSRLKLSAKFTAEYVCEYAKDCVYEDRLNILKNDQFYIFAKQNHKLLMIKNNEKCPDFVITDSPLILSNIYGEINNTISDAFKTVVLDTFNSYNNINYFIERGDDVKYEVNGRIQSEEEAKKIDEKVIKYLLENNINFEPIKLTDINFAFERIIHSMQFLKAINQNQ